MKLKYLLLLSCFGTTCSNASDYLVGDLCTVQGVTFVVTQVGIPFIELNSENFSMTVGSNRLKGICYQTRLWAVRDRDILWVGKHKKR
jgi:hypothetical protein